MSSGILNNSAPAHIEDLVEKYTTFMEMVLKYNESVNLTAITDPGEFETKHFIDSLSIVNSEEYRSAKNIIDVGTGAGFPGMPLAILSPDKEFVLVDSLNKRIKIINECAAGLGIGNVTAVHGRAEDLGKQTEYREQFDICVSRAVSGLRILAEYCIPFVKNGGRFIAYKGSNIGEELRTSENALKILGGRIERVEKIPGMEHCLIYVTKYRNTPKKYPRKAGTPEKNPI